VMLFAFAAVQVEAIRHLRVVAPAGRCARDAVCDARRFFATLWGALSSYCTCPKFVLYVPYKFVLYVP
jgi:hypothetical protein